jgi:hypothetical protein
MVDCLHGGKILPLTLLWRLPMRSQ